MFEILLAYSCGLIDRFRGDKVDVVYSKTIEAIIYGLMVGTLIGLNWWQVLIFALLWATGAAFGWGQPLGSMLFDKEMDQNNLESWQFGIFKTNVILANVLRGLIWGACVTPMIYFSPAVGLVAGSMGIIFPTAIWLSKKLPFINTDVWARQEFYRGWLVGIVSLLSSYI
ncbi:MAG: hypothetical protein KQ78_02145 [Candidatus Izimaplasma bacterium HR2]|nr:MAG: hypothetical protein KQ78_02145 [Candidatus Izimaplasma bacterium HR2]